MNRVTVYTGLAGQLTGVSSCIGSEQVNVQTLPKPPVDDTLDLASGRFLNESAIRDHALRCSARFRNNRFTRVGQDFLDEVKADVEAWIRSMKTQCKTHMFDPLEPDENISCVTGALSGKVEGELNRLICRIIQNKVQRQPSVGKTLRATR